MWNGDYRRRYASHSKDCSSKSRQDATGVELTQSACSLCSMRSSRPVRLFEVERLLPGRQTFIRCSIGHWVLDGVVLWRLHGGRTPLTHCTVGHHACIHKLYTARVVMKLVAVVL